MTKILILGGGFGGVRAALDLEKKLGRRKDVAITLIDKNDSQTFYPALYEAASVYGVDHEHPFHTKLRGTVCIPYSEIFGNKSIEFIQAEVSHINLDGRHVTTSGGATLNFDYLVIALGSAASTFGIPGAEEYACKFKSVEDALALSDKLQELLTAAGRKERNLPINILVGGAGFTGIELAAELSNCVARIARDCSITSQNCTSLTLIESAPAILPMVSEKERKTVRKRLARLGIKILEGSAIEEVGPSSVKLKNGQTLNGDLIIWAAGAKALDLLDGIRGLELDSRGKILVNGSLQIKSYGNIFAIGDNIIFLDPKNQKPVPQMAFVAIEQGRVAAENVRRLISADADGSTAVTLKKYKPSYDVWIAPIGGKYALAHVRGWGIGGFLGYIIRELVDLRYFLSALPFFRALKLFFEDIRVFSRND